MYAIMNRKTGEFVFATDYRYRPPHQRTSSEQLLTYGKRKYAELDMLSRKCNKDYKIVQIKVEVMEE